MTQNSASCLATLDPLYGLFYSTLKVAKKDMEILIMVFLEKISYSEQFGQLGAKMVWRTHNLGSPMRYFY